MANRDDIESAVALAEAETGVRGGRRSIPLCFAPDAKQRARIWTEDEERYLRESLGRLSEAAMAERLGRTRIAVRMHIKRDLHLISMSKAPDLLTAEQIAIGFGCDSKTVHRLIDTGILPGRRLPSARPMRVVDRLVLMRWVLQPDHWIYVKPERVGAMHPRGKRGLGESYDFAFWEDARRMVVKARRAWKDRWLTPGEATRILKIYPKANARRRIQDDRLRGQHYVNAAILKGHLKATRWGNWRIKKSDLPKRGWTINYCGQIVRKSGSATFT